MTWVIPEDAFFTADHHFGHENILAYQPNRGERWGTIEEHDEALIEAWNAKVPPGATVYHLGDVAFRTWCAAGKLVELTRRLNGRITLLRGNHDKRISLSARSFSQVHDYLELKTPDGTRVCLFHYPMATWNAGHYGSWHLHGHSHGGLQPVNLRRLDVGVDTRPDFAPYSLDEVVAIMAERESIPTTGRHARVAR